MARFNEILVGRYNRLVQKLFSMKGSAALVTLSDEMFAVLPLFYGAENRYLEGWDTFGVSIGQAAVAAQFGMVRLRNPVASNMIATVFKAIAIVSTAAATASLNRETVSTDYTTVYANAGQRFDQRGRANPTCVVSSQTAAAQTGVALANVGLPFAGSSQDFLITDIQEIPLLPGDALNISINTVNLAQTATFWWRERFLEDSERT